MAADGAAAVIGVAIGGVISPTEVGKQVVCAAINGLISAQGPTTITLGDGSDRAQSIKESMFYSCKRDSNSKELW